MKYNNIPVLMTASVSTRGMKGACYSDLEREEMYLSTVKYYLKSFPGQRFVFAENSGWDLDDFKAKLLKSLKGSEDGLRVANPQGLQSWKNAALLEGLCSQEWGGVFCNVSMI